MLQTERLLLVAPSLMTRTPAFDRAAALARVKGAALHIVAFDYVEGLATAGLVNEQALAEMRAGYLSRHRQWLQEQAESMSLLGIEVTTEVVWVSDPLREIMIHIKELQPSLVIKDLVHESWLSRALFTSVDVRLLHDCPVPLHLVTHVQHGIPRKIVATVDLFRPQEQFDALNERIIIAAEKLAGQCNAELHLLHVCDLSYIYASEGGFGYASSLGETAYQGEENAFRALADRFGVPSQCRHFVTGSPEWAIDEFAASEDIDVIVMGTVHRSRINQKLLGSTTEQVAYHMPCSLLAINPLQP